VNLTILLNYITCLQYHTLKFSCDCTNRLIKSDTFSFLKAGSNIKKKENVCETCGTKSEVSLNSRPPFVIIENIDNHDISVLDLPTTLSI